MGGASEHDQARSDAKPGPCQRTVTDLRPATRGRDQMEGAHLLVDETGAVDAARHAAARSFMTNDGGREARPSECRSARALR
jgi:hypothetical protein